MNIDSKERDRLYKKVRIELGGETIGVEVKDSELDILLDNAIEDYSKYLNDWLVAQKWGELQNTPIDKSDFVYNFMVKSLEWEKDFTNAYSKQVELASNGNFPSEWTLEVDFIEINPEQQTYLIPEGREVTTVLWLTPPSINKTFFLNNFALYGGGYTNLGGGLGMGTNSFQSLAVLPMYSVLSLASDMSMRENIFQSPMSYRITQSGKNKLLWLYPLPGSRYQIRSLGDNSAFADFENFKVYYYYYNTDNRDECVEANRDHLVLLPSDVKLEKLKWNLLSDSAKTTIRRLLTAYTKKLLGRKRGKYNGKLNFGEGELELEYRSLLDEAKVETDAVFTELKEQLKDMEYQTIMEKRAKLAEDLNKVLKLQPSMNPIQIL
jgi:hypothetical protein